MQRCAQAPPGSHTSLLTLCAPSLSSEYSTFRVSTDGELQGVGLLIAAEATPNGHLRVLAPIKGGPADRAGILPGDEVSLSLGWV